MKLIQLVAFIVLITIVNCEVIVINDMVDALLTTMRGVVNQTSTRSIPIENMKNSWRYRWRFMVVKGELKCSEGKLSDLMSIRRTDDSLMVTDGNNLNIGSALGFEDLTIMYKCQVKAAHILHLTQNIRVRVNKNSIRGNVSLLCEEDGSKANVHDLKVEYLKDITVHSGGGQFHKVEDRFLKKLLNHIDDRVIKTISDRLKEMARQHVSGKNFCKCLLTRNIHSCPMEFKRSI